jgi:hypothetical protein
MPKLMTDAEAEEIRQQVADDASPVELLRSDVSRLLEDRDGRRELEKKRPT